MSEPVNPQTDKRSADIAIVCTHHAEIKPLMTRLDRMRKYSENGAVFRGGFLEDSLRIAVVEAGSGFARHRKFTELLIKEHQPEWVLSVGFSSAIDESVQDGDIALANEICDTHGNSLKVRCPIPETNRIRVRKHVVADSHPLTTDERHGLRTAYEADAVDTTSLAVAQACQPMDEEQPAVRFLSVRGIVGTASEALTPRVVSQLFQPPLEQKKSLGTLWKKFRPDADLAPWIEQADQTAINLNKFLLSVFEQLESRLKRRN
ncbi:MAG TPA: hypothetical protein DCG12_10515 [Planctomycetaceae bacterium]|nr:hypothetical protein [Planctomycetaceae bacterium]|tara:strand:- start:618 stop:1403 length:786 start_codon:yes stop_codon:yes gene_type:complete